MRDYRTVSSCDWDENRFFEFFVGGVKWFQERLDSSGFSVVQRIRTDPLHPGNGMERNTDTESFLSRPTTVTSGESSESSSDTVTFSRCSACRRRDHMKLTQNDRI
jgi:hypothetical protein